MPNLKILRLSVSLSSSLLINWKLKTIENKSLQNKTLFSLRYIFYFLYYFKYFLCIKI